MVKIKNNYLKIKLVQTEVQIYIAVDFCVYERRDDKPD